jgi:hypothetical protein
MYANNQKSGVRDEVPLSLSVPKPSASPTPSAVPIPHKKFSPFKPGKNSQPLPSQQKSTRNEPGMNPEKPGINPEYPGINAENPGINAENPGMNPEQPGNSGAPSRLHPLFTSHTLHTSHRLHTLVCAKTPTKTNNCTLCTLFMNTLFWTFDQTLITA